jgi:hypothetical protein
MIEAAPTHIDIATRRSAVTNCLNPFMRLCLAVALLVAALSSGCVAFAEQLRAPPGLVVDERPISVASGEISEGHSIIEFSARHARVGVLRNDGIRVAPFGRLRWLPAGTPVFYTEMTTLLGASVVRTSAVWCGVVEERGRQKGYCALADDNLIGGMLGSDMPYYPTGMGGYGLAAERPIVDEGIGTLPPLTYAYRFDRWARQSPVVSLIVSGPGGSSELATRALVADRAGRFILEGFGMTIEIGRGTSRGSAFISAAQSAG